MEKTNKIRVAGYIRVSTVGQAKEGESLQVQEDAIKKYVELYGCELIGIYRDEGVSGAKEDRQALKKLRDDAKEGKFHKVVFKKLSRFGRNTRDLLNLYDEFESLGINLISIEEGVDTSNPIGKLLRTVLAGIAEFERETIRTQMREAKLNRLRKGECFVGQEPYGYQFNKIKKVIEAIEEEKNTYLQIVDLFLNQGLSLNDIAIWLNKKGIKSQRNKRWNSVTIAGMLKNRAYTGYATHNKYEYTADGNQKWERDDNGKRIQIKTKPESEWITFVYPEFIDENTWNLIQRKIRDNIHKAKNVKFPEHFLAQGLIFCNDCGGRVSIVNGVSRRDGTAPQYYRCYYAKATPKQLMRDGKERCNMPTARMEEVDKILWDRIVSYLTYPEIKLREFLENSNVNKEELIQKTKRICTELKKLDRARNRLIEELAFTEDEDYKRVLRGKINEINTNISGLNFENTKLEKQLKILQNNESLLKEFNFSEYRSTLLRCLHNLSGTDKKHIVRLLLSPEDNGRIILARETYADLQAGGDPYEYDRIYYDEKHWQETGRLTLNFNFTLKMEKVVGVFNYLKNKGYIDIKLNKDGSHSTSRYDI